MLVPQLEIEMAAYKVKVLNGALDVMELNGKARMVLRGVIDPATMHDVRVAEYQREAGSLSDLGGLISAFKAGDQVPDIEIGVRGDKVVEREGVFYVHSDCYVVDGLQRLTAAKRVITEHGLDAQFRLGATFHLDSDEDWERNRFKILNLRRRRVSPNVILRNEKESPSVQALLAMSIDGNNFILRHKISWGQKMGRGELIPALAVLKVIGVLHNQFGPGLASALDQLVSSLDKTYTTIGQNIWRGNVRSFFDAVDYAFGIKTIAYRDLSPQIKGGFLRTLARVFADHSNFWDGYRLKFDQKDLAKLRQFPIRDPGILALVNGSGSVNDVLYAKLVQHMNSGRRTGQLKKWNGQKADGVLNMDANSVDFADSETAEETAET